MGWDCLASLAHIQGDVKSPSVECIPVVSEFKEVFPANLPSIPSDRDVDFLSI